MFQQSLKVAFQLEQFRDAIAIDASSRPIKVRRTNSGSASRSRFGKASSRSASVPARTAARSPPGASPISFRNRSISSRMSSRPS